MRLSNIRDAMFGRNRWWVVPACAVLGLVLSLLATTVVPKSYETQSRLFINVPSPRTGSELQMAEEFSKARAASYAQAADSSEVMSRVVEELRLDSSPDEVAAQLTVTNPPNTALIIITVRDSNPERAANIADQAAQALIDVSAELQDQEPATSPVQVNLLQRGQVPETPVSPSTLLNATAGLVVGAVVGLALLRFSLLRAPGPRRPSDPPLDGLTGAGNGWSTVDVPEQVRG